MPLPICPLCKVGDNEERFSERGYRLMSCHVCQLFFIDPYPASSHAQHNRVSNYDYENLQIMDPAPHFRAEVSYYAQNFPLIERECQGATSFLDVGCGCGHLLERLRAMPGVRRVGIELNTARAEMARKVAQCEIHEVPFEMFSSNTRFDVISLMNVLSHIPSIEKVFTSARNLLSHNGKLILKVGEMRNDVKKWAVHDWEIPDHLHFLGLGTIDYIARTFGFRVLRHDRVPLSQEIFAPFQWKMPGRSRLRNAIKAVVVRIPLALPALARSYDFVHRRSIYSSFVVMTPQKILR